MSEDSEIDPEMLRREVDQIKDAMGLQERYPSQFRLWLVFGVLVALASAGSQVIYLRDLSGSLHTVVWFGLLGVGWVYQWSSGETDGGWSATGTKPRIEVLWASVFALYFVFVFTLGPAIDEVGGPESDMLLFSLVVGLVGFTSAITGARPSASAAASASGSDRASTDTRPSGAGRVSAAAKMDRTAGAGSSGVSITVH